MTPRWVLALGALPLALGALVSASCQQQVTNAPLRTFERAQRVDYLCLRIKDDNGQFVTNPGPLPLAQCRPASSSQAGVSQPNHLFALVTQSVRGEVAVVDLTQGTVVDQNSGDPGVNFHTVGQLPVDIAVAPDGSAAFVSTADAFKPAIYALPSDRILGDWIPFRADGSASAATQLTTWPVCSLPQKGGPLAIIPRASGYDIAAVLPGDGASSAKVVLIDGKAVLASPPGALAPCPISQSIELTDRMPASFTAGAAWPLGYPPLDSPDAGAVDGGADGSRELELPATRAACTDVPSASAIDAGPDGATYFALRPLRGARPHASYATLDGDFLYVADDGLPLIHIFDVSKPGAIVELEPFVATSLATPARVVAVGPIAVSPPTHDFKRYMYAVDTRDMTNGSGGGGTLMVYDVTDPRTASRLPMKRPRPEQNPFQPVDRIAFAQPVAAIAFARHDFPLTQLGGVALTTARSGVLCNPHQNIDPAALTPASDDLSAGAAYRGISTTTTSNALNLGPRRLRGIFAMATLADGRVMTIDVDDWDAPCRRPRELDCQKVPCVIDSSPWGAPRGPDDPPELGNAIGTSEEGYFPVSAVNRPRSDQFLANNAISMNFPRIVAPPQLTLSNNQISEQTVAQLGYPRIFPSVTHDDPLAHTNDPDWSFTYEGIIPGFASLAAQIDTSDGYASLTFTNTSARFCGRGVEDAEIGRRRAEAAQRENPALLGYRQLERTGDYLQLTEELLPGGDAYWTLPNNQLTCWNELEDKNGKKVNLTNAGERYTACQQTFGNLSNPTLARELPILEAYDDRLIAGRFLYQPTPPNATKPNAPSPQNRIIAPRDATGATVMKLVECCFHRQARFVVRTGGEWLATSPAIPYLHHVEALPDGKRCVLSCDRESALLESRSIEAFKNRDEPDPAISLNSAYAMRSPTLGVHFVGTRPEGIATGAVSVFTNTPRDLVYRFSVRGRFQPQAVSLATNTSAISPQSMRYIEPFGSMGVVDGSSLGLVIVDLNTLSVTNTYF